MKTVSDKAMPAEFPASTQMQREALRRMQYGATGLLGASLATLVAAKYFEPRYPALAYLAAFAEAATIGGLADWYAVVALFRRPLGLPIPHTAILPENQARIADSLGEFIETNFLAPEAVRAKLTETDFSALVIDWLADEGRSTALGGFIVRMLPAMLDGADTPQARAFLASQLQEAVRRVPVAPFLANLIESVADQHKHQEWLEQLLAVLGRLLLEPRSVEFLLEKIREELPSALKALGADGYLLRRVLMATAGFIEEVRTSPDHNVRGEFDRAIRKLIWRLRTSGETQATVEGFKQTLLDRPETAALVGIGWDALRHYLLAQTGDDGSELARRLGSMMAAAAGRLAEDTPLRAEINAGFVTALSAFIEQQKHGVSQFISAQVRAWDMQRMTELIELKIGPDLQFIRFNGTLIGGLIGLLLYTVMHAFGLR